MKEDQSNQPVVCTRCGRTIPKLWGGKCYPCEDLEEERKRVSCVALSFGEINFLIWAIAHADTSADDGMNAWSQTGKVRSLERKLLLGREEVIQKEAKCSKEDTKS